MPSRAEIIAVTYLEREVRRLEKKVATLERRLRNKDAEIEAAQKSARGPLSSPQALRQSRRITDLEGRIEGLKKQRLDDTNIIDEQREAIATLRSEARKRIPREILKSALSASNLSPLAKGAISKILESNESFDAQMVALLKAYDVAARAARRKLVAPRDQV